MLIEGVAPLHRLWESVERGDGVGLGAWEEDPCFVARRPAAWRLRKFRYFTPASGDSAFLSHTFRYLFLPHVACFIHSLGSDIPSSEAGWRLCCLWVGSKVGTLESAKNATPRPSSHCPPLALRKRTCLQLEACPQLISAFEHSSQDGKFSGCQCDGRQDVWIRHV